MYQDKTQVAENGMSFSRTATQYWGHLETSLRASWEALVRGRRTSWQGPGHYPRGAPSATAPGVALPPASLQSCGQPLHDPLNPTI